MGCGHYIAYGKMSNDCWWCLNDSSCKEISGEDQMDKSSAYLLFFERDGLDADQYLPKFNDKMNCNNTNLGTEGLEEDFDSDLKKQCCMM